MDYSGISLSVEHILPELIVVVFSIAVIFVDIFTRGRAGKNNLLAIVSIVGYVLAFVACLLYFDNNIGGITFGSGTIFNTEAFNRMIVMDNLGLFFRMLSLGTAIVTVLLSTQYIKDRGLAVGEYYAVIGLATMRHDVHVGCHRPHHAFRGHRADVDLGLYFDRLRPHR